MGGLSLITGPALEVVSLAEAKAQCRIEIPDDDGLIAGYILAARSHCERYTGRRMIEQVYDLTLDDRWPIIDCGHRIVIPLVPLVSVASINYLDEAGVSQLLAANQYRVVTRSPTRGWIEPAWGVTWPAVRPISEAITVRFTVGYGTQPGAHPDLDLFRQAMLLAIGEWNENRENAVPGQINELPLGVARVLQPLVIDGLL